MDQFDVIVVGGGAAGCVLAARLAEDPSRSVAMLEAGPDVRDSVPELRDGWHLPQAFTREWGLRSQPDPRGESVELRRGRCIGGTSILTRFAVRGAPADYDAWAQQGNDGWGFGDVLPYFTKLETDLDFGNEPWHGRTGPIPVTRYLDEDPSEFLAATVQVLKDKGFPAVEDHNKPGALGVGPMPMSSRDGARVTPADAYLPRSGARNLTLRPDTLVTRVVLEGKRAVGVDVFDGETLRAKHVVIAAGVYGSPTILMRSGIGPADHLRSVDVNPVIDLPGVGANLSDHPSIDIERPLIGRARDVPLLHVMATFHSSGVSAAEAPDLMLWLTDPLGDPPVFSMEAVLLRPVSTGAVRLRSADPSVAPVIELPGLRERRDVDRLAEGYRRLLDVANQNELCGFRIPSSPFEEPDDVDAFIGQTSYSVPHTVGTCAMGPSPDDGAVVDSSGKVHGVERLSVVDASIFPSQISGFPHIPTIMIAERLSESLCAELS